VPSHPADNHSFPTRRSSDLPEKTVFPQRLAKGPRLQDLLQFGGFSLVLTRRNDGADIFNRLVQRILSRRDLAQILRPKRKAEARSEEHTSELQSLRHLVCRL